MRNGSTGRSAAIHPRLQWVSRPACIGTDAVKTFRLGPRGRAAGLSEIGVGCEFAACGFADQQRGYPNGWRSRPHGSAKPRAAVILVTLLTRRAACYRA